MITNREALEDLSRYHQGQRGTGDGQLSRQYSMTIRAMCAELWRDELIERWEIGPYVLFDPQVADPSHLYFVLRAQDISG